MAEHMNRLLTAKLKSTATSYTEQNLLQPFSVRVNVRDLLHSRGQKVRKKVVPKKSCQKSRDK